MKASADGSVSRSAKLRKWAIRAGIALLVFEIFYVIAANVFLRTGLLTDLINKKPEKMKISWDSAETYLPGAFSVTNFELWSQTKKDQIYLRVAEADARISLFKLIFKTIHIRGVDAREVDFRYRERLDRPPKPGNSDEPRTQPVNLEYWPEIPGYSNPPDPKPEEIYPFKKKKHPWTIKITGAEVAGPIKVAFNDFRLEGDGWVGGGVTVRPRDTIRIHRGRLGLHPTRVTFGPEVVTDDLNIDADLRFAPFPAKGAKLTDVLGGISGELSLAGRLSEKAAVNHVITPGISTFGAGTINADLRLKRGVVRAGSEYSLVSEAFHVRIMGLDASGSATVSGGTEKSKGEHVSTMEVALGDFQFVDPVDGSVDISGSGFVLDASWDGLSIAGTVPAAKVGVVVPAAVIHDISAFNGLIPEQTALTLVSGTGTVESKLEISHRVATGSLDLVAKEIALETGDTPLRGDLELHATLAEGDLPAKSFDLAGTTLRLDKVVNEALSDKKQDKLDDWFCAVKLQKGSVTFGKPMAANGTINLKMHDTRPVMALLKRLAAGPKWLSLAPNIKDVDGTLDVDVRDGYGAFDDLTMQGDGFEALGWMHVDNKQTDGRLFVRFKAVMAGVSMNKSKTKIHLSKPRKWFEEQSKGPVSNPGDPANATP